MDDSQRSCDELLAEIRALRRRVVELQLPAGPDTQAIRALLEQIPAVLWTVDLDMRLTWWRSGGREIIGLDAYAEVGTDIFDLYRTTNPEHPAVHAHRAALEGESRSFEVWVDIEGQRRLLQGHIEPLRGPGEAIRGAIGVALDITERMRAESEREKLIGELQDALDRVKTLSGLIPICSHCKSMRDDKGYWQQVDAFVREHSDAEITHGICPDCAKKLMPS